MQLNKIFFSGLLAFALVTPSFAFAQSDEEDRKTATDTWALHLGTAIVSKPEFIGSDNDQIRIFPFIQAMYKFDDNNEVYFRGIQGGYNHTFSDVIKLGVELTARDNRNASQDTRLNGMGDIDHAIELGPWAQYRFKDFSVKGTFRFDVSGEHEGYVLELQAKQKIRLKPGVFVNAYAETEWADNNFMDHYFSVSQSQVIAGRPAFNADAGFYQSALGMNFTYGVRRNVFLRVDGRMNVLHGDAKNSGVSFESTNFLGFVGIGYTF